MTTVEERLSRVEAAIERQSDELLGHRDIVARLAQFDDRLIDLVGKIGQTLESVVDAFQSTETRMTSLEGTLQTNGAEFDKGVSDIKSDLAGIKGKVDANNRLLTMFINDKSDH